MCLSGSCLHPFAGPRSESVLKPERGCTPVLSPNSDRDDLMPPRQSRRCARCRRFAWATASGSGGLGIAPAGSAGCEVRRGKAGPHRRSYATGEVTDVPIRATGGRPRDRCVALLMPVYTARSSPRHRDNLAPLWPETTDPRAWKSAQNERLASAYASTSWLRRPNARGPADAASLSLHITVGRCVLDRLAAEMAGVNVNPVQQAVCSVAVANGRPGGDGVDKVRHCLRT